MDEVFCVIEVPKGSRNKYEWSPEHGRFLLDRFLSASDPTFTGCGVIARPVAVLWLLDDGEREPKVVAVPCHDPNWEHVDEADDLPAQLRKEIEHFFVAYKQREDHDVRGDGWEGAEAASRVIADARQRVSVSAARSG